MINRKAQDKHRLAPVAGEGCLVTRAAGGARSPVAAIGSQQRLQQPAPELGQPRPQRQLHRLQASPVRQRGGHRRGQPPYLGGRVGGERLAEPLFCPSGARAWPPLRAGTGLASQIASLTSTICSLSATNSR
jgi:hypothetical protein